jgi:sterol desaturase/sphingolipid hydroxylase (fatty acid hydroxylase superfamily)
VLVGKRSLSLARQFDCGSFAIIFSGIRIVLFLFEMTHIELNFIVMKSFVVLLQIFVDFMAMVLIEEVSFFYIHRTLHSDRFYWPIHKQHHEWTAPISMMNLEFTLHHDFEGVIGFLFSTDTFNQV